VILAAVLGADAVAISAQIGADDVEVLGEPACDAMPVTWVNGLPCSSKSGGPSPPWRRLMRAPLVTISVRVKPSNMSLSPKPVAGLLPLKQSCKTIEPA
jgi:hypothetical protein